MLLHLLPLNGHILDPLRHGLNRNILYFLFRDGLRYIASLVLDGIIVSDSSFPRHVFNLLDFLVINDCPFDGDSINLFDCLIVNIFSLVWDVLKSALSLYRASVDNLLGARPNGQCVTRGDGLD